MRRGSVEGIIHEVNGSRACHDVNCGSENEDCGAGDDADEVVLKVEPKVVKVLRVHLRGLDDDDGHERDQEEGQEVGDEVMVTEFHVLEIHALEKIW